MRLAPGTSIAGAFTSVLHPLGLRSGLPGQAGDQGARRDRRGHRGQLGQFQRAFTGKAGDAAVAAVTGGVATALGLPASRVFSSSTGVIGELLPHERITAAIPGLTADLSEAGIQMAAEAIMTTDTFPKGAAPPFRAKAARSISPASPKARA